MSQQASQSTKAVPNEPSPKENVPTDKALKEAYLGPYTDAPPFTKDNPGITHGYRINFDTPKKILRSLFMVHNQSVNIWSHFLFAIVIIIALVGFYFVDVDQVKKSMSTYQTQFSNSITHYSQAIGNLSLITEYGKFTEMTKHQFEEIKASALANYQIFTEKINKNSEELKLLLETEVEGLKQNLKESAQEKLLKFQKLKIEFEKVLAPLILSEFRKKLNNTFMDEFRQKIQDLQSRIDSDQYHLFELTLSPNPFEVSRWPIVLFLITAAICLLSSTVFHLFHSMSKSSYLLFNRFDYAGINILIAGSTFPPLYYGLYCHFDVAVIYLTLVLIIASGCFTVCLFEWIHRKGHQVYKALLFAGFGVSMIIPVSHMMINQIIFDNYGDPFVFDPAIPYLILLGASYLSGLYIYTVRCPERNNPGKYDLCGHSHQIWHGTVILGIIFTYLMGVTNYQIRKASACPITTYS